jgi:hypothetical protein
LSSLRRVLEVVSALSLRDDISTQVVTALKAGDKLRVSTLRLLFSTIRYKEIDSKAELTNEEVHLLVGTMIKQRRESIEQFRKGGRDDLADKEEKELEILKELQPEQMSAEGIAKVVSETAESLGAKTMQDMGKLMGAVMGKLKGKADGNLVREAVQSFLS